VRHLRTAKGPSQTPAIPSEEAAKVRHLRTRRENHLILWPEEAEVCDSGWGKGGSAA
jgi:hypothetical protein